MQAPAVSRFFGRVLSHPTFMERAELYDAAVQEMADAKSLLDLSPRIRGLVVQVADDRGIPLPKILQ